MRVIAKGRRQGKTTELIRMSAESGAYIVTTTHRDAIRIVREAEGLGLYINFPLTAEEFRSGQYVAASRRIPGLLFDNADMVLQAMSTAPVLAMSVTVDAPDSAGEVVDTGCSCGSADGLHHSVECYLGREEAGNG